MKRFVHLMILESFEVAIDISQLILYHLTASFLTVCVQMQYFLE